MISLITLLTITSTYNLNYNNCNECVSSLNKLRKDNNTIVNVYKNLYNICNEYNNTECKNILNASEYWLLEKNSTDVCRDLGLCSIVTFKNYITTIKNFHLFEYNNSILVMNSTTIIDYTTYSLIENFTLVHKLEFNQTIIDVSKIEINNNITLLKITTNKYIYYYDTYSYKYLASFYTGDFYNDITKKLGRYTLLNKKFWNKNIILLDWFYNTSMYSILGKISQNNITIILTPIKFIYF